MAGMFQMLGSSGLGDTVTKVVSVKPCKVDTGACCAEKRGRKDGSEQEGDFERLCNKAHLRMVVGGHEKKAPVAVAPGNGTGELHMARKRRHSRRHVALASYGEPMGEIGFLDDLLDLEDVKSAGWILGSGAVTFIAAPKVLNFIDGIMPDFLKPYSAYIKGVVAVGGGFAAFKYGRKYNHDAAVGAGAVLMGLGAISLVKTATAKLVPAVSNFLPPALGAGLPEEGALMAALDAVASGQLGADQDAAFGDWYDPGFNALDASVSEDGYYDYDGEQLRGMGEWYSSDNKSLDAFVTDPNAIEADVEDADAYQDNDGEYIGADGMQF